MSVFEVRFCNIHPYLGIESHGVRVVIFKYRGTMMKYM